MRELYFGEIRKVLRKHTLCGFILILFAGYIFYLVSEVYGKAEGEQYSYQAYQKLAATVDSENLFKEIERLERESEDFSDKELYTDSFQAENALYDEVLQQMRHTAGYAEYADGMVENAQKGEIGLFQENNYTRREQEKIVRDFGRLRTYPVTFAPYRRVYLLAEFDFGDIVILVVLVLVVASLVMWFGEMPIVAAAGLFGLLHLLYLYLFGILIRIVRKKMDNYILTVFVSFVIFAIPVFVF